MMEGGDRVRPFHLSLVLSLQVIAGYRPLTNVIRLQEARTWFSPGGVGMKAGTVWQQIAIACCALESSTRPNP